MMDVEFQSLIGRLQTIRRPSIRVRRARFQSLVGRLQTLSGGVVVPLEGLMFQFLVGRLQTAAIFAAPTALSGFNSS